MTRKSANEISALIITQLETSLNTTIPLLPKAFNRVLAKALGFIFVLLYQFSDFIFLQIFVKTASNKEVTVGGVTLKPLSMWGSLVAIFQDDGEQAELTTQITVLVQGGTLSSGERFVNPNTEEVYTLVGDLALDAATKSATIRAVNVGTLANVDVGTTINFVQPPAAVEKETTVTATLVIGAEAEDDEDYRARILNRFAARPQGGAYADYREWGEDVSGVANIYPYSGGTPGVPTSGPGQVDVYVEVDTSIDPDGIAPAGTLTAVYDSIHLDVAGLATRRPINAYVGTENVVSITRTTFAITIGGLVTDGVEDIVGVQTSIEEGLEEYFLDREPYILGLSVLPRMDVITRSEVAGVIGRIAAANSTYVTSVTMSVGGTLQEIYYLQEGEKAKIGTVTWI